MTAGGSGTTFAPMPPVCRARSRQCRRPDLMGPSSCSRAGGQRVSERTLGVRAWQRQAERPAEQQAKEGIGVRPSRLSIMFIQHG